MKTTSFMIAISLLMGLGFNACRKETKAKVSGTIDMGNCSVDQSSGSRLCPSAGATIVAIPAAVATEFINVKRSSDPAKKQLAAFYFEGLPQGTNASANNEGNFTMELAPGEYVLAVQERLNLSSGSGGSTKIERFYWMIPVSLAANEPKTIPTLNEKNMVNSAAPESFIQKVPITELETLEKLDSSVQPVVHPLPCELPNQMGAVLYPDTELITGRKVKARMLIRNSDPPDDTDQDQPKAIVRYMNVATNNCENIEIKGKGHVEFEVPPSNPSPILVYQYIYNESNKSESDALRACRTFTSCSDSGKLVQVRAVRSAFELPDAKNNDSMVIFSWEGEADKVPSAKCRLDDLKEICSFLR